MMFHNATVSSRGSSSRGSAGGGGNSSCGRNSSMPSLRMRSPLSPKTSYNPLFRHSDITSFDASNFVFNEKRRDKRALRRYNSHDSSTHYTADSKSSSDEPALQSNTTTSTSVSISSPDTTTSRTSPELSPESTGDRGGGGGHRLRRATKELDARDFLERYSLPRVVRVDGGEPLLLYRCFDSFTKIEARAVHNRRGGKEKDGKIMHFPEGYNGWFSLINEKGEKSAVAHTTILQLVREQVCSFISIQPFIAYAGHHPDSSGGIESMPAGGAKFQYLKTQVKGGQLFQLRAVFQHRDQHDGRQSTKSARVSKSARAKDLANRYAQLISQTNQEFYVPLTTKGEFYEIHSSVKAKLCFPGMLDKTGPLALDKDCLYKLTHLLRRVALPVRVKLMVGPLPHGAGKDMPDVFILERKFQEPLLVTCTLPSPAESQRHAIGCVPMNAHVKIARCMLGFDSENRLFKSQRLQAALAFCHTNVEAWYREVRLAPNLTPPESSNPPPSPPLMASCEEDAETDPHPAPPPEKQLITKEVLEKFPKPKKWYKHLKLLGIGAGDEEIEKIRSTDRYKDMSKLIEEKFGRRSHNPVKKSASFMFSTKRIDLAETPSNPTAAMLKCQSLDTQLYHMAADDAATQSAEWKTSKSNISDSLSYDFRMCILDDEHNDNSIIETPLLVQQQRAEPQKPPRRASQNLDEIHLADAADAAAKTNQPDLIPLDENSFITDRLCSEFHVKTKIQKRSVSKHSMLVSNFEKTRSLQQQEEEEDDVVDVERPHMQSVIVQIHENKPTPPVVKGFNKNPKNLKSRLANHFKSAKLIEEDIPYCQVVDEVSAKPPAGNKRRSHENIYAEICDANNQQQQQQQRAMRNHCTCESNSMCKCTQRRTAAQHNNHHRGAQQQHTDYCYVKLGSNGESVTSDSDEAIYNTLR